MSIKAIQTLAQHRLLSVFAGCFLLASEAAWTTPLLADDAKKTDVPLVNLENPMLPETFTGVLKYNDEARVTLMRVWLLRSTLQHGPTGGKVPIVSAMVKLYLGGFDSNETFPMYYDAVRYDGQIGEVIFSESDVQRHDVKLRAPLIRMLFNADHSKLEGDWISPDLGLSGHIYLSRGWTLDESLLQGNQVTERLTGHYIGDCLRANSGRMIRGIEIVTRRSGVNDAIGKPGVDVSTRAMDYMGGTYCENPYATSGLISCAGFIGGTFNHYNQSLNLNFGGAWNWNCEVSSDTKQLSCTSPRHRRCVLDYIDSEKKQWDRKGTPPTNLLPESFLKAPPEESPRPTNGEKSVDVVDCRKWNGRTKGILRHFDSGYFHNTFIEVSALPVDTATTTPGGPGGNTAGSTGMGKPMCRLVGFIHLGFGETMDKGMESIHTAFDVVLHEKQDHLTFEAGTQSDMVVKVALSPSMAKGIWFSKIHGPVGQVVFRSDLDLSSLKGEDYVPELDGIYTQDRVEGFTFQRIIDIGSQRFAGSELSFDPSRQILFRGAIKLVPLEAEDPNADPLGIARSSFTQIRFSTYNFHTGFFSMISGSHIYHGRVYHDYVVARDITIDEPNLYFQPGREWTFRKENNGSALSPLNNKK